ncbi:MAG: hypothetical protein JWM80_6424 [Cyanobacteria bacterium RYN_339]|nr:hypothetical protein [Cyanobacteria bacterium RYN_339]
MATRPPGAQSRPAPQQQVFKPRESLIKFTRFYPLILAGIVVMIGVGIAIGYYLKAWLVPVMMLFPLFSTAVGATIANRLSKSKVVIDPGGLRLVQGEQVQVAVAWNQVTRLTVRQERGDNVYEVWVKNRQYVLPAAYYENGDALLSAVSARTNRPWERQRETQPPQR